MSAEDEEEEETDAEEDARSPGQGRDGRGRFQAINYKMRALVWAQLARRVSPCNVSANISDVLALYPSEEYGDLPCERQVQKMRGELAIAGEAMAAYQIALCRRIISFGFDESTKYGLGVLSTNVQIECAWHQ